MWSDGSRMVLEQGVTLVESNGEALVFDDTREQVLGVDGPAAEALLLLQGGHTFGEATRELLHRYDVTPEVLMRDVSAILDTMIQRCILRRLA